MPFQKINRTNSRSNPPCRQNHTVNRVWISAILLCCALPGSAQHGKIIVNQHMGIDGVSRPYICYLPVDFDSTLKAPLIVFLHGAISSGEIKKDPVEYVKKSPFTEIADKQGYLLLFPFGQKGATWFDDVGVANVLDELKQTVEHYPVNSQKIFLAGFSDGGSGVWYFAMRHFTPFAGFIALNGHPHVACKWAKEQCYINNIVNRPMYVVNTKDDILYPSDEITPIIRLAENTGAEITFRNLEGKHNMGYVSKEAGRLADFISSVSKPVFPAYIELETEKSITGDWLQIISVDTTRLPAAWHKDYNIQLYDDRAEFGMIYDKKYQGKGLKVAGFESEDCLAKRMGIQIGDVILMLETDSIHSSYDPFFYLLKKEPKDFTNLTVKRGDTVLSISGRFPPAHLYPLFRHSKRSGKLTAGYKDNTFTLNGSCIKQCAIRIGQNAAIDPSAKVSVIYNGKLYYNKKAKRGKTIAITIP